MTSGDAVAGAPEETVRAWRDADQRAAAAQRSFAAAATAGAEGLARMAEAGRIESKRRA